MSIKPQTENGFVQIATGTEQNDVLSALISANLSATEYQVALTVIRKTWGWKKKEDWISISQFVKFTRKSRGSITTATKSLVQKNILVKQTVLGIKTIYSFNKDFSSWVVQNTIPVQKTIPVQNTVPTSTEYCTPPVQKTIHTKETITKETIQKKEQLMSADSFFNPLREITNEQVELKAKQFDVRNKDIVYCANLSYEWCIGKNKVEDTKIGWNAFFNQWIIRSIRRHELKTNSDKETEEKEKAKPKLSDEDKWIIQMKKAGRFIN